MAQVSGVVCDVCERFALKKDGWMRLSVLAGESGGIDICSNTCLAKLAKARRQAEQDSAPSTNGSRPANSTVGKFTAEQKLEVVEFALDHSVPEAANAYGIPWQAVARWKTDLAAATA